MDESTRRVWLDAARMLEGAARLTRQLAETEDRARIARLVSAIRANVDAAVARLPEVS